MIIIILRVSSKIQEINAFINNLKDFLDRDGFDIDNDFVLISKHKYGEDEQYSTPYTLLDLDYSIEDVVEQLRHLTIAEYVETRIDKDDLAPPILFIFGKIINGHTVDIKLKIKGEPANRVVCVSFHYAKEGFVFPFK